MMNDIFNLGCRFAFKPVGKSVTIYTYYDFLEENKKKKVI